MDANERERLKTISKNKAESEQWQQEHWKALYQYALTRLADASVAEDLVQETFLAGLKSAERFKGESTVRNWLVGILRHKIIDHFRSQFRRQQLELPIVDDESESDLFDGRGRWVRPPIIWNTDPHQALQSQEFRRVLSECLGTILPDRRTVLLLRTVEGLSADEICKQLEITPTYMWVLMHRARAGLRRCLEERWFKKREKST